MNISEQDFTHILDHTGSLWEEMRGERIFITGGTGFFGCWLLESFIRANRHLNLRASAVVLTRSPRDFAAKVQHLAQADSITLVEGDVRSFSFPAGTFSHVVHAATDASARLNTENPSLMFDTIVDGTRRTLEFSDHCGAKKFLLTSSGAVYGKQPPDLARIPEDYSGAPDPLDPRSAYGQGKRVAEHICTLHAGSTGIEIKIARCFAFVGPHLPLDVHFAIGNFIRDGLRGGPIVVQGDGTPRRSYLYAADLAIWLWTILIKGQSLHPYNVGSDEALSIAEVARCVASQFPATISVEIRGIPDPQKPPEQYVPDIRRARQELLLDKLIPLEQSIKKTIEFNKSPGS